MISWLIETLLDASGELGVDAEKRPLWRDILQKLAPLPTATVSLPGNPNTIILASTFSSPQWSCRTRSKRHGDGKIEQKRGQAAHPLECLPIIQ